MRKTIKQSFLAEPEKQAVPEIPGSPVACHICAVIEAPRPFRTINSKNSDRLNLPAAKWLLAIRVSMWTGVCTVLWHLRCISCVNMKLSFFSQSYEAAVTLDPDQAQAWMNMGGIRHIQVGVALTVFSSWFRSHCSYSVWNHLTT